MSYTQLTLHTLAAALTFAVAGLAARRCRSDGRGSLVATAIGLTLGYILSAAIGFIAMFMPLGQVDFLIANWLKQIGVLK